MYIHPAIYVICLLVMLVFAIYLSNQFYQVAQYKGYSSKKYFWSPFWFGIAGYLLVIALPDRGLVRKVKPKNDELPDL